MEQENQTPSRKSIDNPQGMKTPLMSPTIAHLSGLGLDIKPHIQPGNAFALLKSIGASGSNLPRRSSGKPIYPLLSPVSKVYTHSR